MMKNIFIGIDIGKNGGIAMIDEDGALLLLKEMPDYSEFPKFILDNITEYAEASNTNIECTMEHVGAMPGEGVSSVFKFGYGSGLIYGTMLMLSEIYDTVLRPERITALLWKKMFGLVGHNLSKYEKKKISVDYVNKTYNKHLKYCQNGMADALLIAEYSRIMFIKAREDARKMMRI